MQVQENVKDLVETCSTEEFMSCFCFLAEMLANLSSDKRRTGGSLQSWLVLEHKFAILNADTGTFFHSPSSPSVFTIQDGGIILETHWPLIAGFG